MSGDVHVQFCESLWGKLLWATHLVICCCATVKDAERIKAVLPKRLAKYKLKLNEDKTKIVKFDKSDRESSNSFDFLGFTFYLGLTRRGVVIPKLKSSGKKLRIKLTKVNLWCKENRNKYQLLELWKTFCSKLRGHF